MNIALGGMGAAVIPPQSSTSRGLPTNSNTGFRRMPPPNANMPPPPPPIPDKFNVSANSSGSTLSASAPLSSAQVIALAREAMNSALQDNESQAAEASGVSNELRPGVTIDLSRMNIQSLPDEVVDIIKNELERSVLSYLPLAHCTPLTSHRPYCRLALSHNKLSSFPARFSECTSLRYLNVRNNHIREFPLAV
ncbi:hypothetical protein F5X99DRAFT_365019, partial [Biscogniauxia marginata]